MGGVGDKLPLDPLSLPKIAPVMEYRQHIQLLTVAVTVTVTIRPSARRWGGAGGSRDQG